MSVLLIHRICLIQVEALEKAVSCNFIGVCQNWSNATWMGQKVYGVNTNALRFGLCERPWDSNVSRRRRRRHSNTDQRPFRPFSIPFYFNLITFFFSPSEINHKMRSVLVISMAWAPRQRQDRTTAAKQRKTGDTLIKIRNPIRSFFPSWISLHSGPIPIHKSLWKYVIWLGQQRSVSNQCANVKRFNKI